jgi:hypothetical protein
LQSIHTGLIPHASQLDPTSARVGRGVVARAAAGSARSRWLLWLLAWALVLGPMLGQMHRVVHAAASPVAALVAAGDTQSVQAGRETGHTAENWVHALFAGHGPAGCQLLDQLSHGHAGPVAVDLFTPLAPQSDAPLWASQVPGCQRIAAFFDPRAPPTHRSLKA